jgi:AhpD family alkylhydroperoxidase
MNRATKWGLVVAPLFFGAVVLAAPEKGRKATTELDTTLADVKQTLGFVPSFIKQVPAFALPGAWAEMKGLSLNPNTALPPKIKELMALAVAAQIPCEYCIYAHTTAARDAGATQEEIGEAVVGAALVRHWSTFLNGIQTDDTKFRAEVMGAVQQMKKASTQDPMQPPMQPPTGALANAEAAYEQIGQLYGMVPDFLRKFPKPGIAGAWQQMRDYEMSPATTLEPKYKSLIAVAVGSQVPCRYCVFADTEFAKVGGATEDELNESIAVAALVRHWSTVLNGLNVSMTAFRKDIDRMSMEAKKRAQTSAAR